MSLASHDILGAAVMGVGTSLLMDGWNRFSNHTIGMPSRSYGLLGRWLLHIPAGTFVHASIRTSPRKRFECTMGWFAYFTIGATFAPLFVAFVASSDRLVHPNLRSLLLCGVATVVLPLFVMQPALGLGVGASGMPRPTQARLESLVTHTVFGFGLFLCAVVVSCLLPTAGVGMRRPCHARRWCQTKAVPC